MGSAILREPHVDRRSRSRLQSDPPRARAPGGPRDRAALGARESTRRVDAFRLGAAVIGLGLYVGAPLAGAAWLVHAFLSGIGAG